MVSKKYLNFTTIFSEKLKAVLFKHFDINKYAIDLKLGKQPSYRPIYSLKLI